MMTQLTFQMSSGLRENFSCGYVSLHKTTPQLEEGYCGTASHFLNVTEALVQVLSKSVEQYLH